MRGEVEVLSPKALCEMEFDCLLVAVGKRGVRPEIRSEIRALRPDLQEGSGWLFVA
jgi:hypothetical protein